MQQFCWRNDMREMLAILKSAIDDMVINRGPTPEQWRQLSESVGELLQDSSEPECKATENDPVRSQSYL